MYRYQYQWHPCSETYGHSWSPDPTSLVVRTHGLIAVPLCAGIPAPEPSRHQHSLRRGDCRCLPEQPCAVLVSQMNKPSWFGTLRAGHETPDAFAASASLSLNRTVGTRSFERTVPWRVAAFERERHAPRAPSWPDDGAWQERSPFRVQSPPRTRNVPATGKVSCLVGRFRVLVAARGRAHRLWGRSGRLVPRRARRTIKSSRDSSS